MEDLSVSNIYRSVIDDVIARVKPEFVQEGVDEAVLDELRLLWEKKLQESGVLGPSQQHPQQQGPSAAQPHAAYTLAQPPPVPQLPPMPQFLSSLPGVPQSMTQGYLPAPSSYAALAGTPPPFLNHTAPKQEQQYASVGPATTSSQHNSTTLAAHHIMSQAGYQSQSTVGLSSADHMSGQSASLAQGGPSEQQNNEGEVSRKRKAEEERDALLKYQRQQLGTMQAPEQHIIPQQDGADDNEGDEDDADEKDNLSDVSSENEEDEQCADVVIAQFEKVSRTKTKWRCQLKDGIMNINGRDYLFHTANGEMQF